MDLQIIKDLNKTFIEAQKELAEKSKAAFGEVCKEIFKKYPKMESFSWHQYTPYFNDGDECRFYVHSDSVAVNNICPAYYGFKNDEEEKEFEESGLEDAIDEIGELVDAMNKEVMKSIFGDHVTVTVTADAVTTSTYNHD